MAYTLIIPRENEMNNILSSFTLYEVLRIILPGFYFVYNIKIIIVHLLPDLASNSMEFIDSFIIYTVSSILVGGLIYACDIPRILKPYLKYLPSNLLNEIYPERKIKKYDRSDENEFYKFYYKLHSDSKVKTEIQSGFYHFFINLAVVTLILFAIDIRVVPFLIIFGEFNYFFLIILLNLSMCIFSVTATIIIYKQRLRHSWLRNVLEYLERNSN